MDISDSVMELYSNTLDRVSVILQSKINEIDHPLYTFGECGILIEINIKDFGCYEYQINYPKFEMLLVEERSPVLRLADSIIRDLRNKIDEKYFNQF